MARQKTEKDELEIKEEQVVVSETKEQTTPDPIADFKALMMDYGVNEKAASTIVKHIADTGSPEVFFKPTELLEGMVKFPRQVPPVTRKQILDHWIAINKLPVPEDYEEMAGKSAEEIRSIKPQKEEEKEKAKSKFAVDETTGHIRGARENEKPLTMDEAVTLSERIKRDLPKPAAEAVESPFIFTEEGEWRINPKAKLAWVDMWAFKQFQKEESKGGETDPYAILARFAEQQKIIRESLGTSSGDSETKEVLKEIRDTMRGTADADTKQLLSDIKTLLQTGPTRQGEGEDTKALREQVELLRTSLQDRDKQDLLDKVGNLTTNLTGMREEISRLKSEGQVKGELDIMSKGMDKVDKGLSDLLVFAQAIIGKRPTPFDQGEKRLLTQGISEEIKRTTELDKLAAEFLK